MVLTNIQAQALALMSQLLNGSQIRIITWQTSTVYAQRLVMMLSINLYIQKLILQENDQQNGN